MNLIIMKSSGTGVIYNRTAITILDQVYLKVKTWDGIYGII